jgi:hypothetical protein
MASVGLPLTGAGGTTADVAVDTIGGESYQRMKLHDAADASTVPWRVKETTPSSGDGAGVVRLIGSTAASLVQGVAVSNPTTAVTVSSGVVLGAGSSTNTLGNVAQGPGSSANVWATDGYAFTSANTSRTTVNTSVDASVVAANANTRRLLIQNLTTVDVALGLSTAALTTALANVSLVLSGRQVAGGGSWVVFGGGGFDAPLFTGPIRGITIGSTVVSGGVVVTRFTNT